jgi:hypothetical protein
VNGRSRTGWYGMYELEGAEAMGQMVQLWQPRPRPTSTLLLDIGREGGGRDRKSEQGSEGRQRGCAEGVN